MEYRYFVFKVGESGVSFDFQYYIRHTKWSIVGPIDSTHLNNGHMYPTQFMQIFSSASCVQQLIISERLNQIYIVAHRWKENIFSFPTMCQSSKSVTCIKFKGSGYDRSSTCERKSVVGINTLSPISIDRSTQGLGSSFIRMSLFTFSV